MYKRHHYRWCKLSSNDAAGSYKISMIYYRCWGYAGGRYHKTHVSISEQANGCLKVIQYPGIDREHIIGHSI